MALAITALIGAAAAAMLAGTANATDNRQDLSGLLVNAQTVRLRLTNAVRAAKEVTALGNETLILWVATKTRTR